MTLDNTKKKILIYTDCSVFGGSERLMVSLIKNPDISSQYDIIYSYRKHKLYKIGLFNELGMFENDNLVGVRLISTNTALYLCGQKKRNKLFRLIVYIFLLFIRKCLFLEIFNFIILKKLVKRIKPDIIHINNGGYPGARTCRLMVFAAYSAGYGNIIFQVNNLATPSTGKISRWIDINVDKRVKYFITASKIAQETLALNRHFPIEKILKIPNCIIDDTITKTRNEVCEEQKVPSDGFLLCEVALFEYYKGQHFLINALEILKECNPDIYSDTYLILVGSGTYEEKSRIKIARSGMSDHIKLTGYRTDSQNYISACDLFILPSIAYEDMPLVILSAMSLGRTIISTKLAGIKEEIENNISGILLEPDENSLPEELYKNIITLYLSRNNNNYGREAKKRFNECFSNEKYAERIVNIYKMVED